jgi:universal stress protein F
MAPPPSNAENGGERSIMNVLQIPRVLCPMDLSPISINALEWASAAARARGAELRMLHVVASEGIGPTEGLGFGERDDMMTRLRGALAAIDPDHRRAGAAIRQGDPGNQILQFARLMPADLIVLGAAGAERPARPIGSVTAVVVARSDCPVLIVPAGRRVKAKRAGLFERIVCAVDVAPSSVSVMKQALSVAWETHAQLVYVSVMTEPEPSAAEVRRRIVDAVPADARAWCDIDVVVKSGVPAAEIVRLAERSDVDLLVIGPPRQWTSTTQAVLAKSLCPVLVTHEARPLPYPGADRVTARSGADPAS